MPILRPRLARCLLAAVFLLLPVSGSAASMNGMLSTSGTNTFSLFIRIECSGFFCSFIGGSTPYPGQTQTSNLTGTSGFYVDDTADTLQFSSDAAGTADLLTLTGSNMTFTGFNSTLTGGVTSVVVSNLVAGAANAALASIAGFDLNSPPQAIAFLNTLSIGASATTNAPNLQTIALPATPVASQGTLNWLGDPDNDQYLDFQIQNLRGAFQTLTTTATLGVTLRVTLRATFTLNLIGESFAQVPEPASFAMVGLGLAAFGLAARRRQALS